MKSLYPIFIFLAALCLYTSLRAQTGQSISTGSGKTELNPIKMLTVQQMQSDFDLLRNSIREAHGGLYRFSDSAALNRRFDHYRSQLTSVTNQLAFISLISAMIAEIRDGHMRLEYDGTTVAQLSKARLFPFGVMVESEKLKVMYNDTPDNADIVPGMQIISINGHTVPELLKLLMSKISGDGYIQTGKKKRLERSFAQNYWLFADQSTEFTLIAKDISGKIVTAKVPGVMNSERTANRNTNPVNRQLLNAITKLDGPKQNISLRFEEGGAVAGIRIRAFDGYRFITELDSVFHILNEKKTKALILDLRGNGGGVDEYGAALVAHFTDKPFRYFDRIQLKSISPSFATWKQQTFEDLRKGTVPNPEGGYLVTTSLHSGVGEQKPAKNPFKGKVFVLMDGGTFSTSADVTAGLRKHTKAIFIGEESGGTYEGNTSGLNALIKLPNSELGLKIHMYGYWNAGPKGEKGRGTLPDYPMETQMADLLEGRDMQWKSAVAMALKEIR